MEAKTKIRLTVFRCVYDSALFLKLAHMHKEDITVAK